MNIELPKKFEKLGDKYNYVSVKDGVLEIYGYMRFDKLMVQITYLLKDRDNCYYCHNHMEEEDKSLDHLFPRAFGGIGITNNYAIVCKDCNNIKNNLNEYEFKNLRKIHSYKNKEKYRRTVVKRKVSKKYDPNIESGYDIPQSWLTFINVYDIKRIKPTKIKYDEEYMKELKFAKRTGKISVPIIISSNKFLLEGEKRYIIAERLGIMNVPVVRLDNVVVKRAH